METIHIGKSMLVPCDPKREAFIRCVDGEWWVSNMKLVPKPSWIMRMWGRVRGTK